MSPKTTQVRVRLSPAAEEGIAVQVALTPDEHAALSRLAGHRKLSSWIRTVAERAALRGRTETEHRTVLALLTSAAEEARLPLSSWLRLVSLQAAGMSVLVEQLAVLAVDGPMTSEQLEASR